MDILSNVSSFQMAFGFEENPSKTEDVGVDKASTPMVYKTL